VSPLLGDLLPLRLASFRAYPSGVASPQYLQDSIRSPRLTATKDGIRTR